MVLFYALTMLAIKVAEDKSSEYHTSAQNIAAEKQRKQREELHKMADSRKKNRFDSAGKETVL